MSRFYANITLQRPEQDALIPYLKEHGDVAYVSPAVRGAIVIFHEDLSSQEDLARRLSQHFSCPALLVMGYGQSILLYQLYQSGEQTDAYVSTPHDDLDTGGEPTPGGNPAILCAAFGMEQNERRVETILRKPGKPGQPYEYAVNRHGELTRALGLPQFAAGASFQAIEMGELPEGPGFEAGGMKRTF